MYKTYILNKNVGRHAIRLDVKDGPDQFITFSSIGFGTESSSGKPRFATRVKKIQDAIESTPQFEDGLITLESSVGDGTVETKSVKAQNTDDPEDGLAEYADVTTIKEAKAVLTADPYNVAKTSKEIATLEGLLAKAAELGVSFPNLATE